MIEKFKIIRSALWQKIKEKPKKFILWLFVFILALCYLFNEAENVFAAETGDSTLVSTDIVLPDDCPPLPDYPYDYFGFIVCEYSSTQYRLLYFTNTESGSFSEPSFYYDDNGCIRVSCGVLYDTYYCDKGSVSWNSSDGSTSLGSNTVIFSSSNICVSTFPIYSDNTLGTVSVPPSTSPTIASMSAEAISKAVTKEIVGLIPLAIGFLVALLALLKALRTVYHHLRAA